MSYLAIPAAAAGGGAGGVASSLFGSISGKDLLSAGSAVLGKALSPAQAAPAYSTAASQFTTTTDHSGWTVSTGGGTAYGTPPALKSTSVATIAIVAGALLLGVVLWKKL